MTSPSVRSSAGAAPRGRAHTAATAAPATAVAARHGAPSTALTAQRAGWGALPLLTLVASSGLVVLAMAFTFASRGLPNAEPLYWLSFLIIAVPITIRLAGAAAGVRERAALVVVLGIALYVAHYLRYPQAFYAYDELLHLRTLDDILATGRLFNANPLLTVSPFFPGMELVTAGVVQLSGTDPFTAAHVVLGSVRVLFSLGLFALYREASSSARVAGLAAAIYMLNPNFTFFDSQFAYESLALPLVPVLLLATAMAGRRRAPTAALAFAAIVIAAMIVVTHHVTTYAAAGIFAAWLVIHLALRWRDRYRGLAIAGVAGLVTALGAAWLIVVAPLTIGYLAPPLVAAFAEVGRFVNSGEARIPFESATGELAPLWERLAGLGMAGLLTLAIPIGLIPLLARLRRRSLALLLGLLAIGYPVSLLGRLMPTGAEAAGRSLAIVFLGLSFVVALAVVFLVELPAVARLHPRRLGHIVGGALRRPAVAVSARVGLVAALAVVVTGGIVVGTAPATRFPGPYLVAADARSVDDYGLAAAAWTLRQLGPNQAVAGDRVNRLLLGSYGDANVVFHGAGGIEAWQIFLSPSVGQAEIDRIRSAGIRYIVIDRRLSTALPLVSYYYEQGEIYEGLHTSPISPAVLGKWDDVPGVDRVYDSGPIQIYDVSGLTRGG